MIGTHELDVGTFLRCLHRLFYIYKPTPDGDLYLTHKGKWERFSCKEQVWFFTAEAALEVYAHTPEISNKVLEDLHWEERQV